MHNILVITEKKTDTQSRQHIQVRHVEHTYFTCIFYLLCKVVVLRVTKYKRALYVRSKQCYDAILNVLVYNYRYNYDRK